MMTATTKIEVQRRCVAFQRRRGIGVRGKRGRIQRAVDLATTNGTAVFNHDYDTAGRLTRVTRPDGKIVDYTVDAAGNRTSLKYPGTPVYTVNYSYDELGRPKDVKENGTTTLASWAYPDRLNSTVTYAITTSTSRTVQGNVTGALATLTNTLNGEAPQFNLFYNKTGQVTNQRITVPAYRSTFKGSATFKGSESLIPTDSEPRTNDSDPLNASIELGLNFASNP